MALELRVIDEEEKKSPQNIKNVFILGKEVLYIIVLIYQILVTLILGQGEGVCELCSLLKFKGNTCHLFLLMKI